MKDQIEKFIKYHIATTRRVWESIEQISNEQFLQDDAYSRGSIRNLMVHISSTDLVWMTGLKSEPRIRHLGPEQYPTRESGRALFEQLAAELTAFVASLTEADLEASTAEVTEPRWLILMHIVNHGTDHRATVLQKLYEFGAPTFNQDFVIWHWEQKEAKA